MKYTILIERDEWADPKRYPSGLAWRSAVLDENGEEMDGEGDIATYEEACMLVLAALHNLIRIDGQQYEIN